jgi:hypothetical protein
MNVVYNLDRAPESRSLFIEGRWENVIHDRLRASGHAIGLDPKIVVKHEKYFTMGMFTAERFYLSRAFAAERVAGAGLGARLGWAVKSLGLPPLLLARIVSEVVARRQNLGWFIAVSPLVAMFTLVWSVGETVGYVAGPGASDLGVR